ncbi:MAG TPA: ATP-binding protein [Thermomicrobiales bacterium]|nr:ATP-binding protein [Thermomicrobiales bacterium]
MGAAAPLGVLLIEDNPGDARLIRELLADVPGAAVRLDWADRLAAGLARLAETAPDAALLDLSLPDSHGLATFDALRARAPGLPIVVLSGLADAAVALDAVQRGAQDYLVKGRVDGDGLLRALRYAIERQRAAAERARLLAAAERLAAERAAILGQIADGVVLADPQGRVTFANAAARRLYGGVGERVRGDRFLGAYRPLTLDGEPYPPAELPLARAALRGEAVLDAEWCLARPDGTAVTVQGSAVPVLAEDGARLGAVLTVRDVTARRALERQKEEFFANVSHDLRTPLAAIKASIGVVLANEPAGTPAPLHRLLTNIDLAATEMARMVDDLLELARLQSGRVPFTPRVQDLRDLAGRAARAVEPLAAGRGQRLEVALPDEPLPVAADAPLLERAILNLLGNAQKYGREGGLVRLALARCDEEARVAVSDDGPGIPAEDQARIFERYYRPTTEASRRQPGSGLGLPIVAGIVALHGGRVLVASAPSAGATFTIALPAAPGLPAGAEAGAGEANAP